LDITLNTTNKQPINQLKRSENSSTQPSAISESCQPTRPVGRPIFVLAQLRRFLAVGRLLPVYPDKQPFAVSDGISQMG
jgi:hypothetical protein